jgi:hypothetical protein
MPDFFGLSNQDAFGGSSFVQANTSALLPSHGVETQPVGRPQMKMSTISSPQKLRRRGLGDQRSLIAAVSDSVVSYSRAAICRSIVHSAELIAVRRSIGEGDNNRIAVCAWVGRLSRRNLAIDGERLGKPGAGPGLRIRTDSVAPVGSV